LTWVKDNFEWSERQARNFIQIADKFGNRQTFADLDYGIKVLGKCLIIKSPNLARLRACILNNQTQLKRRLFFFHKANSDPHIMRIQNINYQATAKIPKITHYKTKTLKTNLTKGKFVKLNK